MHEKMTGVGAGVGVWAHGRSWAALPGWVRCDEDVLS